jgi:hypothetical protein
MDREAAAEIAGRRMPIERIATLDAILSAHAGEIGSDLTGYRNHAYRVANIAIALASAEANAGAIEKIAIAAAFHDLGIWTARTFDYLKPSVGLALAFLERAGRGDWRAEIAAMISEHHKIRRYRENPGSLVEPFRRADWADVTRGIVSSGLPRGLLRALYAKWPSAGFHKRLVALELAHLRKHPLDPLPMLKF